MWVLGAAVLLVVIAVVGALLAERIAREGLRTKLVGMCTDVLGATPSVVLDVRRPVLLQLLQRRLSGLEITTRDVGAGPHAIILDGHARGVAPVPDGLRVDALTATATLRLSWIRHVVEAAQAGGGVGGITVSSVTLMPRRKSLGMTVGLPVAFGLGVDIRVVVAVGVKAGRLTFRVTDLSMPIAVIPVPIPVAWAIDSWVKELRPTVIPPALDALTITRMHWQKKSVTLDLSASDTTVPLPS
ncbi:hypothetical protein [Tsukamurella pseudospumae]|uniref:DUF2993 domain-containing protein n=1 Tax=Tsukamurella pseudospumae TaxID=239498 RepID=A0A138AWV1_9ACTN|nr:hypothetical protein [Tsukamurella pseudospumae]KXP01393.1 hypothetical protein AXK61_00840 [Tsukamurella pseudospumae]KXP14933.1 hypothetical protein AXK60_03430 [Tsukamurella pseudospumae]